MKIQVLSDLHREVDRLAASDVADIGADVVILAGDIDRGSEGVGWAAQTWPNTPVLYVGGNHELYGSEIESVLSECRQEAVGTSVHFLEQEAMSMDGVRFLGATLWADFGIFGGNSETVRCRETARRMMNDYRVIENAAERRRLMPEDTEAIHARTVAWLDAELAVSNGPTVVVTHHAPHWRSLLSHGIDESNWRSLHRIQGAYASDLSALIERHQPALWIHGHTHRSADYRIGSTRIVSHQRGRPQDNSTGWNPGFVIELSS